jgi:glycosyltransferase involved in cell wall biosynthesis
MSDGRASVLLQVCANDHPPFAEICRYYAAAAELLSWRTVTIMLEARGAAADPEFYYPASSAAAFTDCVRGLLAGREPLFTLCHRYRAYRAAVTSGAIHTPLVVVAHEFGLLRRRRRRWQQRSDALLRRPPVTFAGVSDSVRDELAGITGDAVLLPNGIDLARADAARLPRDAARAALDLGAGGFTIGVVGRLHRKKNPELAVAGFADAAADMPDARLVFVGDGELADAVRERVGTLPVTLTGFVPDAARLMAAFDLLLMPSGEREAFGMVALEAMAAGVPVLCGPAPGPRFVVGDAGRYFAAEHPDALGDALRSAYRAWRDGDLPGMARRVRARAEREFSLAAAAGRLEALAVTQ